MTCSLMPNGQQSACFGNPEQLTCNNAPKGPQRPLLARLAVVHPVALAVVVALTTPIASPLVPAAAPIVLPQLELVFGVFAGGAGLPSWPSLFPPPKAETSSLRALILFNGQWTMRRLRLVDQMSSLRLAMASIPTIGLWPRIRDPARNRKGTR